tara:strand:+ start:1020 stop:1316 length:297 start_codon:yes stop_codon:yes gene_type:complete
MNAHLKGLKKKHEGLRDIAVADLQTYLDSQVAIGDHPHIGVAIEEKIEEIAKCDGVIETIERYGLPTAANYPRFDNPTLPVAPHFEGNPTMKSTGSQW